MIHIGIVDDHAVVRAGLRELLSDCDDMQVIGEAANGAETMDLLDRVALDVLTLDVMMPGQSGPDLLAQIRARAPELAVLIVSGYPESAYASTMIREGASGYLDKNCSLDRMADAIRTVAQGRAYITPEVAESLAPGLVDASRSAPHEQLSLRELQVLMKLAQGKKANVIARELFLAGKTVSNYRTRVLRKLGFTTDAEVAYYALKNGLIE